MADRGLVTPGDTATLTVPPQAGQADGLGASAATRWHDHELDVAPGLDARCRPRPASAGVPAQTSLGLGADPDRPPPGYRPRPASAGAPAQNGFKVLGVSITLTLSSGQGVRHLRTGTDCWQVHGSIPLAGAGLTLGVISRISEPTPATHDIVSAVTVALLLAALVCALIGTGTAIRHQRATQP